MPATHVWAHDGPKDKGNRKARKPLRFPKLPLLGSNQDSSDPESGDAPGTSIEKRAGSRQITTDRDKAHTKAPTVRHTTPRPLALGGGNTVRV